MGLGGVTFHTGGKHASMRPRRVRLGWVVARIVSDSSGALLHGGRGGCASDGSSPASSTTATARCFNEAEAGAPRMVHLPPKSADEVRSFNEAEAGAPRMGARPSS